MTADLRVFGSIGNIAEFDGSEEWKLYEERLEQYFLANGVENSRRVPVLLSVIGAKSYKIVKDLSDPILPKDRPYSEICDILGGHFTPTVSLFRKRLEFYNLHQKDGESIGNWYVSLKSAAIDCKFGIRLNDVLKDKFVSGLKPGRVLDRICEEDPTITDLKNIVELALKYETTVKNTMADVHKLDAHGWKGRQANGGRINSKKPWKTQRNKAAFCTNRETGAKINCYACGRSNHKLYCGIEHNFYLYYVT